MAAIVARAWTAPPWARKKDRPSLMAGLGVKRCPLQDLIKQRSVPWSSPLRSRVEAALFAAKHDRGAPQK
jgi:hypothetical protein